MDGPSGHHPVVFSLDKPPLLAVGRRLGCQFASLLRRANRTTMTCYAIDRAILRFLREILHFVESLIDHSMHESHLACRSLRSLVVAREILFDVTVGTAYT